MEEQQHKWMVAVRCFTYNQSKYITDALNGFVIQQTNFPFVVLVVDDASTDGEQEVIRRYVSENFDTENKDVAYEKETDYAAISYAQHKTNKNCYIVIHYLKQNHYGHPERSKKKMQYLSEWRDNAKYEALCEGDDYWIDSTKLQFQYDFMELNPDCSMCFHNAFIEEFDVNSHSARLFNKMCGNVVLNVEDVVDNWLVPTAAIFAKMSTVGLPNPFPPIYSGDYSLVLKLFMHGKICYIDKTCSVYRKVYNGNSISVQSKIDTSYVLSEHLKVIESFKEQTKGRYDAYLDKVIKVKKQRLVVFTHLREKRWWIVLIYPKYIFKTLRNGTVVYWLTKVLQKNSSIHY